MMESTTNIYLFALFFLYPLLVRNGYRDIMTVKTYFYWGITALYILLMLIFYISSGKWREIRTMTKKDIGAPGFGFAVFSILSIVSWIFGSNHREMFFGNYGRYMGLCSILCCVITFYFISQSINFPDYFWKIWCLVGVGISVLAVVNHLGFDPFFMYEAHTGERIYISTVGNLNVYAAYLSILLSLMMARYLLEKQRRWFYGIFLVVGFMGMVASNSDSVYLVVGVVFCILLWWCRDLSYGLRYLEMLLMWFGAEAGMLLLRNSFENETHSCEKLQGILKVVLNPFFLLVGGSLVLVIYLGLRGSSCTEKNGKRLHSVTEILWKWTRRIALGGVALAVLFVLGVMLYVNLNYTKAEAKVSLGYLWRYLYFSDQWGTSRMKVWEAAVCIFGRMNWREKIFGMGPAGFYHAAHKYLSEQELAVFTWGRLMDAHNGYLQYLISVGILGVLTFYGSFVALLVRFFKEGKRENNYVAYAVVVAAFMVQAIANNPHIFIEPLAFAVVAMGYGRLREEKKDEKRK